MRFEHRLKRLEKLAAEVIYDAEPFMRPGGMSAEERQRYRLASALGVDDLALLDETITRFRTGESLEAIARSQGRPWDPPDPKAPVQVSEDDLREGLRLLLEPAEDKQATEGELDASSEYENYPGLYDPEPE